MHHLLLGFRMALLDAASTRALPLPATRSVKCPRKNQWQPQSLLATLQILATLQMAF